ncbi:MAG: ATP-binding protein [Planctomycetaceae bacterium]|nr:ATP-binding protein [Planctomycetaceae bacterium]
MKSNTPSEESQLQAVMIYAADLELEVDRLRRRDCFLEQEARRYIRQVLQLCNDDASPREKSGPLPRIAASCEEFAGVLRDLSDPTGYHPAFDQVTAVAVRPMIEQVFRWQQRLSGVGGAVLRLDLETEHVTWFPARLRHILDNLISNALRFPDRSKGEIRVGLSLRSRPEGYEFQVADNGLGKPSEQISSLVEFFYRAAPIRAANLDVGFAVVKLLVEQCCGSITVTAGEGQGTNVTVLLPRFDLDDYID